MRGLIPILTLMMVSHQAYSEVQIQAQSENANTGLTIQESGQIDASVKGKNLSLAFYDGREIGVDTTKLIRKTLSEKGIQSNGGWLPKSLRISAYTRTYASDKAAFDSGAIMIKDIKPEGLVMSKLHASEYILRAHQSHDITKLDAGMLHEGTKLTQAMGSSAGVWGGVAINVVANLTRKIFSSTPGTEPIDGGHLQNDASRCGDACNKTHHVVVFTVLYDAEPSHYYSLSLEKVDTKVDEANLTEIANQGLRMVTEKIAEAVIAN
ncbi:hypothetical protein INP77_12555 [Methylophilus sp. 13]|uniref:hypothetical protein n=1 Tax=Methylophilus sp. 13 TaxID=2781018 RepID=UPI00188E5ECE|nr:hypothetical protein [Methylophilus sp. 13]MBF5040323.1 hypothetical protein [Methylophilus sp. 13]